MLKNRVIPFGYCMKNGEITTEPKEVYAVATIFSEWEKVMKMSANILMAKVFCRLQSLWSPKKSDTTVIPIIGTKTWSSGS